MIQISKPNPEDAEAIHEMIKASWYATYINKEIGITKEDLDVSYTPEIEENQVKAFRNRAENPTENDISLVAKDGSEVIGFARFRIKDDMVEWVSLYAHPDYFGKGVGTALWQEAKKLLPLDKPISVEVATYTKAVDFYKKLGFIETGEKYPGNVMEVSKVAIPLIKMVLNKQNTQAPNGSNGRK